MIRYLIALAFCLFTVSAFSYDEEAQETFFPSTPEQIASLHIEPTYLIGGLISPLSGQPVLRQTDLVVKGTQPPESRLYSSLHPLLFWHL